MKVKKRKKSSRYRGTRLNRRGYKNRTKGSGNQGGKGMAGTGKRGDQRKTLVLNLYGNNYFKKDRSTSKKGRVQSISLRTIEEKLESYVKKGIAKKEGSSYEVKLDKFKIVGDTKPTVALVIHAKSASKGAIKALEESKGKFVPQGN